MLNDFSISRFAEKCLNKFSAENAKKLVLDKSISAKNTKNDVVVANFAKNKVLVLGYIHISVKNAILNISVAISANVYLERGCSFVEE